MEELIKKLAEQMSQGFDRIDQRLDRLEDGQQALEKGQQSLEGRLETLEIGQQAIEGRLETLEIGQQEIKESLKHNMTLIKDNFTHIRKDLRLKVLDIETDVDLLFREVEGVKRQSHKIEQRLGN